MSTIINTLKRKINQVLGLFPSSLPTGVESFYSWIDSIQNTYTLPTEDRDSIVFSFSTMIMHLGPTAARKPKYYFVLALRSAAAKQVAGGAFQEVKLNQKAKAEAQLKAEATAASAVADAPKN